MPGMSEPLALTLGQQFELERMTRVIDSTGDAQSLRGLAKQLLQAWQTQRAATEWMMRQQLGSPPSHLSEPSGQSQPTGLKVNQEFSVAGPDVL